MLADRFEGKRLNSPNDVVVKSDGSIWFTDPSYGIDSEYEGDAAPSEIGASQRLPHRPRIGRGHPGRSTTCVQPNGLAFSPDETLLYVADTGQTHDPDVAPVIRAYPLGRRRRLGRQGHATSRSARPGSSTASASTPRATSGPRPPTASTASPPTARCIGKILIPEVVANVGFGGRKRNRLFICATTSVFALYVNARGCGH